MSVTNVIKLQQLAAQRQPQQHQHNSTHGAVAVAFAVAHLKTGRWLGTYLVVSCCGKFHNRGATDTDSVGWWVPVRR